MKRPLAYITAAWLGGDSENAELAAQYCRTVYEAGFSPICPPLYLPLFLNDAVPGILVANASLILASVAVSTALVRASRRKRRCAAPLTAHSRLY